MLVGRSAETEAVDRLLGRARDGHSGVLVVRGEAGIGKSALLEYAADRAGAMTVLRAVGIEAESEFAFAALHQLLRPVLHRIDRVPDPQAHALCSAFALSDEPLEDRFRVSLAALSLLADAAEERPLVCVVDDAQWLDGASADTLVFVARRLEADAIALLFAARDDVLRPFEASGLEELRLQPLAAPEARALLGSRAGSKLSPAAIEWVVDNANGIPLAIVELPQALSAAQQRGEELVSRLLPAISLEQAYLERVERLPPQLRSLLVIAAAEDTGERATIARAAALQAIDPAGLAEAEEAGLVRVVADRVEFRHPLVRSAVYRGAGFAERERAHLALAAVLDGPTDADRRAWHRAAATIGPDADVADELERTAQRARLRSGYAATAAALERAAELSVDPESEARRLVGSGDAAWHAGQPERATALLERASPIVTNVHVRAQLDLLRGQIEWRCGSLVDAHAIFMAGAARIALVDPAKALEMLFAAGMAAVVIGDFAAVAEAGRRAAALSLPEDEDPLLAELLIGSGSLSEGKTAAEVPHVLEALERTDELDEPHLLVWAAATAALAGDTEREAALRRRAEAMARTSGAVDVLVLVLTSVGVRGVLAERFDMHAEVVEGLRLARETGLPNATNPFFAVLAWIAAVTGRDDECHERAADLGESARARGAGMAVAIAEWALAILGLGRGRPDEAITRLQALRDAPVGVGNPLVVLISTPDLVEACVRCGRFAEALAANARLQDFAQPDAPTWALAAAARCRALVSDDADAEGEFAEAVRLYHDANRPFGAARTGLLFGEHLRRNRRPVEAREHLRAALEIFERLGAVPWADRARTELRAAGETTRTRDPDALAGLTPQELQVAQFAGQGLSNKEIAAQLLLSPRTVEYHLRKVFQKLGISSRTELIRLGVGDDEVAGTRG